MCRKKSVCLPCINKSWHTVFQEQHNPLSEDCKFSLNFMLWNLYLNLVPSTSLKIASRVQLKKRAFVVATRSSWGNLFRSWLNTQGFVKERFHVKHCAFVLAFNGICNYIYSPFVSAWIYSDWHRWTDLHAWYHNTNWRMTNAKQPWWPWRCGLGWVTSRMKKIPTSVCMSLYLRTMDFTTRDLQVFHGMHEWWTSFAATTTCTGQKQGRRKNQLERILLWTV